jgi:RHS repeat-associated protein
MISKLNPTTGSSPQRLWSCVWRPDIGSSGYGAPSVSGTLAASFEPDAFGREFRATSIKTPATGQPPGLRPNTSYADLLPFRFRTKFTDNETGLYYYGHRFYDPLDGRWLSRDPIGEAGWIAISTKNEGYKLARSHQKSGGNCLFVHNNGVQRYDRLGLEWEWESWPAIGFHDTSKKRDCAREYADCIDRGNTVCSIAGCVVGFGAPAKFLKLLKGNRLKSEAAKVAGTAAAASAGGVYGTCLWRYRVDACEPQQKACEQWNKNHGFK